MDKFMVPEVICEDFITYEFGHETFHTPSEVEELLSTQTTILERHEGKWFGRLTAPGYLDCTDWQGPYDTQEEALQDLYEIYGQEDESYEDFIDGLL